MQQSERDGLVKALAHWRFHPVDFVQDALGASPDPWQVEALEALADPRRGRVSIRSCHGPGKTALDAWSIIWFMMTHFPCRVPCTAPTSAQLHDVLWAEISNWLGRLKPELKGLLKYSSERLEWVASPKESFAVARTSRPDQPEALQGFHCPNMLFILDEASGIPEQVFEVAEGALTEAGAKVLMTSNPTRNSGYFYDSQHRMRHRFHCIKVGAQDSPRVSDAYVEDMRLKYGEESNVFRVRVLGEFPLTGDDQTIPMELVEAAMQRDIERLDVKRVWGLDVARFGTDQTALAVRQGNSMPMPTRSWQGLDTMAICGRIVRLYDDCTELDRPHRIYVDVIGIGAGVVDRLRELDLPVVGVNVGETPTDRSRFMRLRDEMYWRMRAWFERRNCAMVHDAELATELTAPTYKILSTGKISVESKDEMKQRGIPSPDRSDAFMLTFAERDRKAERPVGRGYRREKKQSMSQDLDWVA